MRQMMHARPSAAISILPWLWIGLARKKKLELLERASRGIIPFPECACEVTFSPRKCCKKYSGEQFQRRYWNPHWIRVAEEDEAMKIGPWVARKRPALGKPDSRSINPNLK